MTSTGKSKFLLNTRVEDLICIEENKGILYAILEQGRVKITNRRDICIKGV